MNLPQIYYFHSWYDKGDFTFNQKKIKESFSRKKKKKKKKKGLIFLNSVPIQNVQLMTQIKLLCKQFFFLCVANVFNVLGAVDLFKDFTRKN